MFILPMNSIIGGANIGTAVTTPGNAAETGVAGDFKNILQDTINNVEETEAVTKVDAYNLSIGNMDDMHTMMINTAKADVALQTMVQLRNKVLESYQAVMNTGL
ncbi:flagellar hook-basal body complex protein FliE [Acetobacterium carbinolicum]|jgi:flagellar hook-basal body complex protein FliE|uniref:flagellar hook-basal body complex protein FliE n=1 Tax=Acetobacterium TaxID=33951 RepID=UPI000DBECAA1|nr:MULTISPECIES: flagellar hook-basal body complex protein FliE [unclassified Acetobacterium]AWW26368.1 flagellar hook-basal body complex protein FliE [Acetobacterium sp. KB-1]MDK2942894.1 flagellar hook-basal body complex protein FliE [Acetobacterium sp.]MDZ5726222.1 flagellar hook-basal body complex protein FliE [Acetobacterium sp. K1/6]